RRRTGGGPPQTTVHQAPGSSRPVGSAPKPAIPPPTTTVAPPPPPPPAPAKTITRRVGDSLNKVVRPLPLVGPTAAGAIDAVVTTVDRILPLPPPAQVVSRILGG
ncbi:MAG: hypothetical protein JWN32_2791, partial [Solirubrobacterales bacterium]|nr:hypothetical protein [Solirubrobacterales bacterium]